MISNVAQIFNSTFTRNRAYGTQDNDAGGFGGALYVTIIKLVVSGCTFDENSVKSDGLFTQFSSNGGAMCVSGSEHCVIETTEFNSNYVVGGSGGALFVTDLAVILMDNVTFYNNTASSTYVFKAHGGALAVYHGSMITVNDGIFTFNKAYPQIQEDPRTYSGVGGGVYVQSSSLNMSSSLFFGNEAQTGQFDSGAAGGAFALEDCSDIEISDTVFSENSAKGYSGFSSYSSSGTGGAMAVLFSALTLNRCDFGYNWVTAGGSEYSLGGAISIFYEYTSTSESAKKSITIVDCNFILNLASGEMCAPSQVYRAGQGGAIFVIGVTASSLLIENTKFSQNIALTLSNGIISSYGGALAYTQGTRIYCNHCHFVKNVAWNGLGNDIATAYDATDDIMSVYLQDPFFNSANLKEASLIIIRFLKRIIDVCDDSSDSVNVEYGNDIGDIRMRRVASHTAKDEVIDKASLRSHFKSVLKELVINDDEVGYGGHKDHTSHSDHTKKAKKHSSYTANSVETQSIVGYKPGYPSIVITVGNCTLFNPVFNNTYKIYVGNFVSLLIKRDIGSESPIYLNPASLSVFGNDDTSNLNVYAFQGNVSIWNPTVNVSVDIESLCLIDSTLKFRNNLTVSSDSFILASTITSVIPEEFNTNNNHSLYSRAFIQFYNKVSTGIDVSKLNALSVSIFEDVASSIGSVSILDKCELRVFGEMILAATISPGNGTFALLGSSTIVIMPSGKLTVGTNMYLISENPANVAIVNNGVINIGRSEVPSADIEFIIKGILSQGQVGVMNVLLSDKVPEVPIVTMSSNVSFFGTLNVSVSPGTDLALYPPYSPSSWKILGYAVPLDSKVGALQVLSPEGLNFGASFSKHSVIVESEIESVPEMMAVSDMLEYEMSKGDIIANYPYTEAVTINEMSCSAILKYYPIISGSGYKCYVCLQNSSCTYCGASDSCISSEDDSCHGGSEYSDGNCCPNGCSGHGTCDAKNSDNSEFACKCDFWYQGNDCGTLSLDTYILIACLVFLIVLALVTAAYYHYYRQQNKKVLAELRIGLLDANHDSSSMGGEFVPKTYLQSIQQDLILRDVFVPYEEIKIEGKIGEGSFGVVFKGTFRGAQVAIKQMKSPVYMQLSENDIEEFRKEAYMMSR